MSWEDHTVEEVATKWVEALRSGKYKQCRNKLADGEGGFCCLGVIGAVMGEVTNPAPVECEIETQSYSPYSDQFEELFKEECDFFWVLNDSDEKTFTEIADIIEEKYLTANV